VVFAQHPLLAEVLAQLATPDALVARMSGSGSSKATVSRFADGEVFVRIDENVRGADVFIVQPTNTPVRQHHGAAAPD
jgi:phosphoribosylpyrophosphate synthetase